jgi:hypothetical protein
MSEKPMTLQEAVAVVREEMLRLHGNLQCKKAADAQYLVLATLERYRQLLGKAQRLLSLGDFDAPEDDADYAEVMEEPCDE